MAIIKILKNSMGVDAIRYNENRCKAGEAQLLGTANMGGISSILSPQDFFKIWNEKNKRVKNPMLHAVISVKGTDISDNKFLEIGKQWLEQMGYKDNPYMIYVHNNTNNKHIHLVTSRIQPDGTKVSDSFEKERGVKVLHSIEGINQSDTNRKQLSELLRFSFSTRYQFMELCKKSGFQVWSQDGTLYCKKAGTVTTLPFELIDFCSQRYHQLIDDKHKKKLQGLIYKYAAQLTKDNFVDFMKEKFGLDFIFYGKDGTINGYTIIDYNNKSVYKGSEVFGIKKFAELLDIPQNPDFDFYQHAEEIFVKNRFVTYDEFCFKMAMFGYEIDGRNIKNKSNDEHYFLNDKIYNRLKYNERMIYYSLMYRPRSSEEAFVISRLAKVSAKDLLSYSSSLNQFNVNLKYYENMLHDCISNNGDLKYTLNQAGITVILTKDNFFLLDSVNHVTVDGNTIGVEVEDVKQNIYSAKTSFDSEIDDAQEYSPESPVLQVHSSPIFGGLLYVGPVAASSNRKNRRKKTRK